MNNTNTINGLFHIPDEGSFLKKLILSHPTVYNPDVVVAFKALQEVYPDLKLLHNENYFSLILPAQSPGLTLEAMLITTEDQGQKLFSLYHRLHFDKQIYPQGPSIIEADAFLCLSAVLVNIPLEHRIDALASLLNYQVQEALDIEITMLSLADGDTSIAEENITPFIDNAIGRYILACRLDDIDYTRPREKPDLSRLLASYCDIPLLSTEKGIEHLDDITTDIKRSEDMFIADYASSTIGMMLLLLEKKTSSAMLETEGLNTIKEFFLNNQELYKLRNITGMGETLGNFQQLRDTP